jgi:glutathione synthase/RimK-type ligase-like ATP-grasp enzyme
MRLGILRSFKEIDNLVESYIQACEVLDIEYVLLDLLSNNWIKDIKDANIDGILVRVKGNIQEQKSLYDERLNIITEELGIPIYPSKKELFLYENKRMCAYWLAVHNFPHPKTHIFYRKEDALIFLNTAKFPLVFKSNSGASSSGVEIIKNKTIAKLNVLNIFGLIDPRLTLGKIHFGKFGIFPVPKFGMTQKHYVLIQDFIPIKWEWRIIKIGDSYFGHQKLLKGNFASGSDLVGWVEPPKELLFMIKNLCSVGNFDSMAMDVLESLDGKFYINELQSLFGSFLPYQMKINNIPGRFLFFNDDFIFEEGEFNSINSNLLRVKDFIQKLEQGYYLKYICKIVH